MEFTSVGRHVGGVSRRGVDLLRDRWPHILGCVLLIVDDDRLLLKSLQDTLEGAGHMVAANGGRNGIGMLETAMPTMPVILLTGWGQRLEAEGEVPLHVDRVLSKPPKLRELREALGHCCSPECSDGGSPSP